MEADFLNKSHEYIQAGKFEKAQIILRRALNENPNYPKALELSGDLVLKMGRTNEAIQRYEHASDYYTKNDQYAEAIICLEKIIRIDQTNDEVYSRLADLYRFYGLPNRAMKTILNLCSWAMDNKQDAIFASGLRKIVDVQPKNLPLRLSFVKLLLSMGRSQEAEDELRKIKSLAEETHNENILEEISKLMPQTDGGEELDPKSRIELGNLLYEIGSKDEAIVEFEKAVSDLIESGETEDALNVLNRIVEIDPNNKEAINKIKELKSGGAPLEEAPAEVPEVSEEMPEEKVEEVVEETTPEAATEELVPEAPSEEISPEEAAPAEGEQGLESFQDLSEEIEGFVAATEAGGEEETKPAGVTETAEPVSEETPQLEGKIADIEFLLKEAEAQARPSFEVSKEFDDFRSSISWQDEDMRKTLDLAKMAYDTGLYKTALSYVADIKERKETWPLSLEINGGSLIRLGRYTEARKAIAPSLLFEEIPEDRKLELRYLLASAYEGLGDFDNAMREIERILNTNPEYKDVKEIYALLGGKEIAYEEPEKEVKKEPPHKEEVVTPPGLEPKPMKPAPIEVLEQPPMVEETYPTILEEKARPEKVEQKVPEKLKEEVTEVEEKKGENIAFL